MTTIESNEKREPRGSGVVRQFRQPFSETRQTQRSAQQRLMVPFWSLEEGQLLEEHRLLALLRLPPLPQRHTHQSRQEWFLEAWLFASGVSLARTSFTMAVSPVPYAPTITILVVWRKDHLSIFLCKPRPKALDPVGVRHAIDVFADGVLDALMRVGDAFGGCGVIGVDHRVRLGILGHEVL